MASQMGIPVDVYSTSQQVQSCKSIRLRKTLQAPKLNPKTRKPLSNHSQTCRLEPSAWTSALGNPVYITWCIHAQRMSAALGNSTSVSRPVRLSQNQRALPCGFPAWRPRSCLCTSWPGAPRWARASELGKSGWTPGKSCREICGQRHTRPTWATRAQLKGGANV